MLSVEVEAGLFALSPGTVQAVWFGSVRFGLVRFGSVRLGSVRFGSARLGLVWFESVWFESVRFCSDRFCSVLFGSVRFGLVCFYKEGSGRGGRDLAERFALHKLSTQSTSASSAFTHLQNAPYFSGGDYYLELS